MFLNTEGGVTFQVSDSSLPAIAGLSWRMHSQGYVFAYRAGQDIALHRLVMGLTAGNPLQVDHINGDRLDNRLENLRLATRQENSFNRPAQANSTSGLKGVTWDKGRAKWAAKIQKDGKTINLGRFSSPNDAANAYSKAANELFGEFAYTNKEVA